MMERGDRFGIDYSALGNHCQRLFQTDQLDLYHFIEIELACGR